MGAADLPSRCAASVPSTDAWAFWSRLRGAGKPGCLFVSTRRTLWVCPFHAGRGSPVRASCSRLNGPIRIVGPWGGAIADALNRCDPGPWTGFCRTSRPVGRATPICRLLWRSNSAIAADQRVRPGPLDAAGRVGRGQGEEYLCAQALARRDLLPEARKALEMKDSKPHPQFREELDKRLRWAIEGGVEGRFNRGGK
jgi:hypothetical protein